MKRSLSLLIFGLIACTRPQKIQENYHVARVFMHEPTTYTLMVKADSSPKELKTIYFHWYEVRVIADVPVGNTMWARSERTVSSGGQEENKRLEIHIHAAGDINAGGWNHGKFGSGQTVVVE